MSTSNPTDRVEIITSAQRRRRWTASEKVRIVEETFEPSMTVSLVARRHGVARPSPRAGGASNGRLPNVTTGLCCSPRTTGHGHELP